MGKGEGKGECAEVLSQGRAFIGCLCCLAFLGPILIVVGIIFLVLAAADPRGEKVSDYNEVVKSWQSSNYRLFADNYCPSEASEECAFQARVRTGSQGTTDAGSGSLLKTTSVSKMSDDGSDLDEYSEALWFTNTIDVDVDTASRLLRIDLTHNGHTYNAASEVLAIKCERKVWKERDDDDTYEELQWHHLSSITFVADCKSSSCDTTEAAKASTEHDCNGFHYTLAHSSALERCRDDCRTGVVHECPQNEDTMYSGTDRLSITLSVRSSEDPYVYAGEDTDCSYDFGLTAAELFGIGIGCLVGGIVYTALLYGGIYYFFQNKKRNHIHDSSTTTVIYGGSYPPAYPVPINGDGRPPNQPFINAPQYGAPPAQYGAPPAQYGAPPAQYGAPAPQYGAPAPQYGAPAPQYGAPAPQYGAPAPQYGAPAPQYGAPPLQYGAPAPYGQPPIAQPSDALPTTAQPYGAPQYASTSGPAKA